MLLSLCCVLFLHCFGQEVFKRGVESSLFTDWWFFWKQVTIHFSALQFNFNLNGRCSPFGDTTEKTEHFSPESSAKQRDRRTFNSKGSVCQIPIFARFILEWEHFVSEVLADVVMLSAWLVNESHFGLLQWNQNDEAIQGQCRFPKMCLPSFLNKHRFVLAICPISQTPTCLWDYSQKVFFSNVFFFWTDVAFLSISSPQKCFQQRTCHLQQMLCLGKCLLFRPKVTICHIEVP